MLINATKGHVLLFSLWIQPISIIIHYLTSNVNHTCCRQRLLTFLAYSRFLSLARCPSVCAISPAKNTKIQSTALLLNITVIDIVCKVMRQKDTYSCFVFEYNLSLIHYLTVNVNHTCRRQRPLTFLVISLPSFNLCYTPPPPLMMSSYLIKISLYLNFPLDLVYLSL